MENRYSSIRRRAAIGRARTRRAAERPPMRVVPAAGTGEADRATLHMPAPDRDGTGDA